MTDKPTPTDAELEALLLDKLPASKHYIRPVIEKMVAAMQAAIDKWGQPAQAAEPVAREPLTDAEIAEEIVERGVMDVAWPSQRRLNQFARAIERAHGITKEGGQHGTESST